MDDLKIEIPAIDPLFVPFGAYDRIKQIISTNMFFPVMLDGPTGIGKTLLVEQACATLGREMIRVNISAETDEDGLMGGLRLEDGATKFMIGAVPIAMQRGAILLLDECDLGKNLLCLQSVLEGKGYFLKRNKEWVMPAPGFNIIATMNTKGVGDTSGVYIGTQVLNEAFLERFAVSFSQGYPDKKIERDILTTVAKSLGAYNKEFVSNLIAFANKVRESVAVSDSFQHTISTRRLVHIIRAFSVVNDQKDALDMCMNRFDDYHKKAFLDFYDAIVGVTDEDDKEPEDTKFGVFNLEDVQPF